MQWNESESKRKTQGNSENFEACLGRIVRFLPAQDPTLVTYDELIMPPERNKPGPRHWP
jgi:hypothetical protein